MSGRCICARPARSSIASTTMANFAPRPRRAPRHPRPSVTARAQSGTQKTDQELSGPLGVQRSEAQVSPQIARHGAVEYLDGAANLGRVGCRDMDLKVDVEVAGRCAFARDPFAP